MNFQAYTVPSHPEWACIHLHAPPSEERTPIHLVCIIDTSSSMETDNKLINVKHSLQFLLNLLTPLDYLSIITFSDKAKTIISQSLVTSVEKHHILTRISFITHETVTNLSSAMVEARSCLFKDTSTIKQGILLLTDGHANTGIVHPDDICIITNKTLDLYKGTSISCIGYGTDHNINLLQQIAVDGGGAYYVVNNVDHVASVFGDILGGLVSCSYQQISVSVPENTELQTRYSVHSSSNKLEICIGDLPADMDAIFLAKLSPQQSVTLKFYDLKLHDFVIMEILIKPSDTPELKNNAMAHYIRYQVLSLIDQVLKFTKKNAEVDPESVSHLKQKQLMKTINDYIQIIPTCSESYPHLLWDILKRELEYCKYYFENKKDCCEDWQSLMSQHNLCLGLMKGISSGSSQSQDIIPGGLPPCLAPTTSSDFSSPLQRQFSNQIQQDVLSQSNIYFKNTIEINTQENFDEKEEIQSFAPLSVTAATQPNPYLLPSHLFSFSSPVLSSSSSPASSSSSSLLSPSSLQLLNPNLPPFIPMASGSYDTLPTLFSSISGSYDTVPSLQRHNSYYNK